MSILIRFEVGRRQASVNSQEKKRGNKLVAAVPVLVGIRGSERPAVNLDIAQLMFARPMSL